jgi:hypothetical protein
VKKVGRPDASSPSPDPGPKPRAKERPDPKTSEARPPKKLIAPPEDLPDRRESKERAQKELLGEGRIGDESVTARELMSMGSLVAARHLMVLLAKKRKGLERRRIIEDVGNLLIEINQAQVVRRLLLEMTDAGRIVDIYPLEVLAYVLEQRSDLVPGFDFGAIVQNKAEIEAGVFEVDETISIKVPLSLKMRGFALEGGGAPGYFFGPGAPAEYHLEIGEPGAYCLLLRGDLRKLSLIDRVKVRLEGPARD